MQTSAQGYKINITHPVYCILTQDDAEGVAYGDVKKFGEAMEISITPSVSSGELYGNGAKVDSYSKLTGLTVSFKNTKVPIETRQDIYDLQVSNGVVQESAAKQATKYIAFGYETEQTNGLSEYTWLLKGRPKPINTDLKQSEQNVTYSTDTIEIDFVKRVYDDMLRYFADLSNPDFTQAQADAWFLTGPVAPVAPVSA